MRRLDISMPLFPGMPKFPGDPEMVVTSLRSVERGDPYSLSGLSLGSHTGTHIDPPVHFFRGGAPANRVDLDALNGPCVVVDAGPRARSVGPDLVARLPPRTERVLFRTSNSSRWAKSLEFFPDYVGLTVDAADALARRRVRLVGIDALSVENDPTEGYPVHRALLGRGAIILEGILLSAVPAGKYRLECLPLPLRDGDGAPARAALLDV
ncbi:MAG TPA: cyclase family protein [Thermoplasmata archaeon]|nr:cyclase family protein [Thermoplasmata archaeon]